MYYDVNRRNIFILLLACVFLFMIIQNSWIIIAITTILTHLATTISNEMTIKNHCTNVTSIPMWSWGFARQCCHVYPNMIGHYGSRYEGGKLDDPTYIIKNKIANNTVIYVATTDFPHFLDIFLALPKSYRIVIVTGLEDIGVPHELWHLSRSEFAEIWHDKYPPKITKSEFIGDSRLVKWFTQNFDLNGCNAFSCSKLKDNEKILLDKIHPIPIGLDFHSRGGKDVTTRHFSESLCEQRKELDHIRAELSSFPTRPLKVLAAFSCHNFIEQTRGDICRLLEMYKSRNDVTHSICDRSEFWRSLGSYAFALAPAGHGIDTHRLWEILQMQSVPIVVTSTLDVLYSQLPVIIAQNWSEVFQPNILSRYKENIQQRFGENPFAQESVKSKLTAKYWIKFVRNSLNTNNVEFKV